jgi:hypothetical protein
MILQSELFISLDSSIGTIYFSRFFNRNYLFLSILQSELFISLDSFLTPILIFESLLFSSYLISSYLFSYLLISTLLFSSILFLPILFSSELITHHLFSSLLSMYCLLDQTTRVGDETELRSPISCYICHKPYKKLHFFYHQLCPECAAFNYRYGPVQ